MCGFPRPLRLQTAHFMSTILYSGLLEPGGELPAERVPGQPGLLDARPWAPGVAAHAHERHVVERERPVLGDARRREGPAPRLRELRLRGSAAAEQLAEFGEHARDPALGIVQPGRGVRRG